MVSSILEGFSRMRASNLGCGSIRGIVASKILRFCGVNCKISVDKRVRGGLKLQNRANPTAQSNGEIFRGYFTFSHRSEANNPFRLLLKMGMCKSDRYFYYYVQIRQ